MTQGERYKHYYNEGYNAGSVKGYEQAIKKACEWLAANAILYATLEFLPGSDHPQAYIEVESLLKEFKKAMEGGDQ